jgi:hypothetical protein
VPYGTPLLLNVLQLWLITAMKPLTMVSAPLIIMTNAANATHPVQAVVSVGSVVVVYGDFRLVRARLVLDMVAPFGAVIGAGVVR